MRSPKGALSAGEEQFALHCRVYKLNPVREYVFAPPRKYRFDFAFPDPRIKIAVEIEGGTLFGKSYHSKGDGYVKDCNKYNLAALNGWKVLRYTTEMVMSGQAIDEVRRLV